MSKKQLAENIFAMVPILHRRVYSKIPKIGHSNRKLRLLHMVNHHRNRPMKQFSEKMYISKPNLSRLVDELINDGLIVRVQDDKDRRIVLLDITEEGKKVVNEKYQKITLELTKVFDVYTEEEVKELNMHFEAINTLLNKIED